ncbi:endonuclease/exonuclease/phosphatase family protein [Azohydromonas caseinilytica]|uniref:EEP domain-containing protein n=1 Tax=Azohydromonas caseinilytica TaxID=2728836 RepID=A0A848F830_9BURK|nr:endonuclease/exonuclease/phosphatase family protein [Azohydromonas caseinilytica]NML15348.1 EEP domain-containing protein [Azohydromonas caseinilytica]
MRLPVPLRRDDAPAHPAPHIRVLTLNLHKGFTVMNRRYVLAEIREAVRATGADIVFLQEVAGAASHRHDLRPVKALAGKAAHRLDGRGAGQALARMPQYEFLADTIWHQHAYGRNAVSPGGHHGNALLSKFPILRHRNVDVSLDLDGVEKRGLLHCELELPDSEYPLHAICVHLGLRESQRQRQIDLLGQLLRDAVPPQAPLVIAGDFNDWRLCAHARLQKELELQEVHAHAHGRTPRTFPARHPVLRLDRIYVRNLRHAPIGLPKRPWSHLSDHAPLAAEVML